MIRIHGISLSLDEDEGLLGKKCARLLGLPVRSVVIAGIRKKSVDARKKDRIVFVHTVDVRLEEEDEKRVLLSAAKLPLRVERTKDTVSPGAGAAAEPAPALESPAFVPSGNRGPVVVAGCGPAGLFAALSLARAGVRPLVVERGRPVEERVRDVESFIRGGDLDPESNIQFGEGGAGTFSDGKLSTNIRDPRCVNVLEELVAAGAPPEILYQAKPHIGTDLLRTVVENLRGEIGRLGGSFRFETRVSDIGTEDGALAGVELSGRDGGPAAGTETLRPAALVLAVGYSARDTFGMLHDRGFPLEARPFSIGLRIEHAQEMIDQAQFGRFAGHPRLGPADYKLVCHAPGGRSVYTFCMCPGGWVVPAVSEPGGVVTNGMSEHARSGANANSAILVGIDPRDYGGDGPLAGIAFQRRWESAAFRLGGGNYHAPVQRVGDFLAGRPSTGPGEVLPTYRPGVRYGDLAGCLPDFAAAALRQALPLLGRTLRGFDHPDAILTAVESRSSSPVRVLRGGNGESKVRRLFPAGEGAGYVGGIMSAAVDGIRAAEAVLRAGVL